MRDFSRPAMPGRAMFDALPGADPADRVEVGLRLAELLVRGARTSEDRAVVDRVVTLADEQGLETLAELWSQAPAESLAGALWRLYLLRTWVRSEPSVAAREFDAGRAYAPVHEVVAGVVEPPGPDEVTALADVVLRGLVRGDLAVTLERAAAFLRVVAAGRAALAETGHPHAAAQRLRAAAKLQDTAADLERLAQLERADGA